MKSQGNIEKQKSCTVVLYNDNDNNVVKVNISEGRNQIEKVRIQKQPEKSKHCVCLYVDGDVKEERKRR